MPPTLATAAALLLTLIAVLPNPAAAQSARTAADAAGDKAAKPAAARPASRPAPTAVPADVRARIVAKMPGAKVSEVASSPIPGVYEVTMGGVIAYVSADGRYLMSGNLYDLETQANLTDARRSVARAKVLASTREDQMIVFSPPNPKMTITVFTDIDCGFCRKFHNQIADVNKAGVKVRYMMYPRTGPGTESWSKAESVFCSADRKDALTRAKRGEDLKTKDCKGTPVDKHYALGEELGVQGTPAIFTQSGEYIGGFLSPEQLVQAIRGAQAEPTAAR